MEKFDLIIVGAGPAGYTASIYASRYKVSNMVVGVLDGGLAAEAHKVCNYPSETSISGMELMAKMRKNAEAQGGRILLDEVLKIEKNNDEFKVFTRNNKEFISRAIILAIGTKHRKLGLDTEQEYLGKGVSYCATCDGLFFKDKVVGVIGAGDSANTTSLYLAQLAKKVYQIFRKPVLKGEKVWIEQVEKNPNIELINNANVTLFKGDNMLSSVELDREINGSKDLKLDGMFIEIGSVPETTFCNDLSIDCGENGYVKVKKDQSTNTEGVWAAGDITDASDEFRQIVTACSEGAIAAHSVFVYLQKLN